MGRYLITGGTGSIGVVMLRELLATTSEEIVVLSRDEEKQDNLRNLLRSSRVEYRIGDIRDRSSVDAAMKGVSHVFHAAALKQVPSCEFFPMEAIRTNVDGSSIVLSSAIANKVETVVCLSTDKAVFPINAMGMSKAMMEKTAQAAAREQGPYGVTRICCVRYGNVICSRGSVIPLFIKQIHENRPITLTVPEMTRFLMPLRESVALVNYAFEHAKQGDLFIRKAVASNIGDLVEAVKNIMGKNEHPVECIGLRHGEKYYETLATSQELLSSEDLCDYWRVKTDLRGLDYRPFFSEGELSYHEQEDFNSNNTRQLNISEIESFLLSIPEVQLALGNSTSNVQ